MSATEEVWATGDQHARQPWLAFGAAVLTLVLVAIAGWLGLWQLDAWQARRAAEARDLTALEPIPLTEVLGPDQVYPADQVGRPVSLEGEWLPSGTFYVSGRERGDVTGYWVVTPVQVSGAEAAIPVVRGWSPEPDVDPPRGEISIAGWLQPPEGRRGLSDADPDDDVVAQLRIADAVQRVDVDLWGAYVVLDPDRRPLEPGLEPADLEQLPDVGRFTAFRNFLYALEWWFFGAFAAFIGWRYTRELAQGSAGVDPDVADSGAEAPLRRG